MQLIRKLQKLRQHIGNGAQGTLKGIAFRAQAFDSPIALRYSSLEVFIKLPTGQKLRAQAVLRGEE